jgi:hypothetical protein
VADTQKIKKSDRVEFKPEWRSASDGDTVFVAVEDEHDGRVMVESQVGMFINPQTTVMAHMLTVVK